MRIRGIAGWGGAVLFPVALAWSQVAGSGSEPYYSPSQAIAAMLSMSLLIGVLRRIPLLALVMMLLGCVFVVAFAGPGYQSGRSPFLPFLAVDLAVAFIVATRTSRVSTAAVVLSLVVQVLAIGVFSARQDLLTNVEIAVLAIATAFMAGRLLRERREHAAALRSRAVADAVTAERLRIARELHDMVAHTIGIVALQAGAAKRVIDTQPTRAREALGEVETASRDTLSGLRRMLGALRQAESEAAPLHDLPGLADLDRLAEATTAAGVRVDVRWQGEPRPLPPEVDLSAFRIIQEAVTNVVRHADTRSCIVSIDYQDEDLAIDVADGGRGHGAAPGTGYGLVGMRERVALLHGDFTAGPRPEGGFRVTARLPLPTGAT
ncbi:sensor histidine kinase [Actinoallomurus purpureus]|uniref:sensor histidine kinase n=1 Tax=Actinoallomurus purpureus TaxID=478114 RepID=UPI002093915A|nr:sensor histidine kinase [Actinoallomurus purpureus]MCO6007913.1 sensor histidine kinase [Actinoallomurus purpureus]